MVPSPFACPHVTRGLIDAQRFSLSPIMCRTRGYKQSFFPRTVMLWNSLPNGCCQKIIVWICLKRNATPTFLLDGDIFDVIGNSLCEHLTLSTVYLKKYR